MTLTEMQEIAAIWGAVIGAAGTLFGIPYAIYRMRAAKRALVQPRMSDFEAVWKELRALRTDLESEREHAQRQDIELRSLRADLVAERERTDEQEQYIERLHQGINDGTIPPIPDRAPHRKKSRRDGE